MRASIALTRSALAAIVALAVMACTPGVASTGTTTTTTASAGASASTTPSASTSEGSGPAVRSFFVTPSDSGIQPVVDAIASARKSIRVMMFHLTVPDAIDAFIAAAARGVDVRIILDAKGLENRAAAAIAQRLVDRGITVTRSSPAFSITHTKVIVIDEARALVMSLNLTRAYDRTRDYAVVTDDRGVVDELLRVFAADVENAAQGTASTPPLANAALVWSPVNAEARITSLIDSAEKTIVASTENLGAKAIDAAFVRAAKRGVRVRIVTPLCDQNSDPLRNVKPVLDLERKSVDARVLAPPATHEAPYPHAKMMIVDGKRAFVGSINFSENSLKHAREVGIVVDDRAAISAFSSVFESDWRFATPPPEKTDGVCPKDSRRADVDQSALPIAW